jgi:hypothetical protein
MRHMRKEALDITRLESKRELIRTNIHSNGRHRLRACRGVGPCGWNGPYLIDGGAWTTCPPSPPSPQSAPPPPGSWLCGCGPFAHVRRRRRSFLIGASARPRHARPAGSGPSTAPGRPRGLSLSFSFCFPTSLPCCPCRALTDSTAKRANGPIDIWSDYFHPRHCALGTDKWATPGCFSPYNQQGEASHTSGGLRL